MPARKQDAHRALELLEDYHAKLTGTDDRQLRSAIEKVIRIFRSRLFQALLDIQEFYEETLLDSGKSKEQKTHETMEMAAAWEKQSPMPHKKKKEVAVSATAAATAAAVVVEKENDKASSSPVASDLLPPPPEATVTFERQAFLDESMPPEIPPSTSGVEVSPIVVDQPGPDKWQWEQETIILEKGSSGLGFSIAGGYDHPHSPDDNLVYVTKIIPTGGAAKDGRLRLDDCILSVNGNELKYVTHGEAVDALRHAGNRVILLVKRKVLLVEMATSPKGEGRIHEIKLVKAGKGLGFSIAGGVGNQHIPGDNGIFVTKIIDTGAAAADGRLSVGDRILRVNEGSVENVTHEEAVQALKMTDQTVILLVEKAKKDENDGAFSQPVVTSSPMPHQVVDVSVASYEESASPTKVDAARASRDLRTVELKKGSTGLGFNIIGGEDGEGIFISFILAGGAADRSGMLRRGDQIIEVNGADMRLATHEDAALALKGAGSTVTMVVQYNPNEYAEYEKKLSDLRERAQGAAASPSPFKPSNKKELFVRALFDYDKNRDSGLPSAGLSFQHGDILHVINASDDEWWQARLIGPDGRQDDVAGVIPSKKRVERRERSRQKSVKFSRAGTADDKSPGGGRSRKRSFNFAKKLPFFRKKHKEAKEEKQEEAVLSYEEVTQEQIAYARPVIVLGPIKDRINDDLIQDFPEEYGSCVPHTTRSPREYEVDSRDYFFVSREDMERSIQNHEFIEAGQYNENLYGTSVVAVRDVALQGKHCILDVSGYAIKRLQVANLYPIAIFIRLKSVAAVKDMISDKRSSEEHVQKVFERAGKLEQEFAEYFTGIVTGDSYEEIYRNAKEVIRQSSGPLIWVPRRDAEAE
ncbi:disks large homolog 1-like [Oscarella lobularis]